MRFYTKSHKYSCGIDLQTKKMYVCILDSESNILIHKNIATNGKLYSNSSNPTEKISLLASNVRFPGTGWLIYVQKKR